MAVLQDQLNPVDEVFVVINTVDVQIELQIDKVPSSLLLEENWR